MSAIETFFTRLQEAGGERWLRGAPLSEEVLRAELDAAIAACPAIADTDPLWVRFLGAVGGATIGMGRHTLAMFGFDRRICPHLVHEEGELLDDGFLAFAVIDLEWPDRPTAERYRSVGFAFDVSGARRAGVYVQGEAGHAWIAASFEAWMHEVVEAADDWSKLVRWPAPAS